MSRPIDYQSRSQFTADEMFAVMVDPEYLRARLQQLGGPGAALLEHSADDTSGRYRLRHGIDRAMLPPIVGSLVSGNLTIERTETLRREGAGRYGGTVDVAIAGTPASAAGTMRLADTTSGSELAVHADVTVDVPFLGGRIEEVIAEQVRTLLAGETAYTLDWMARKRT